MTTFTSATYHPDILTVEYAAENGDHFLRSGGTIAWRFNNPGNLRPGSKYTLPIGRGTTKRGDFLIFPTVEAGRTEKKGLLLRKYKDGSVTQMMERYAPRTENDTDKYLDYITTKSGVSKEAIVGTLSAAELSALMQSMEQYEGFNAKADTRKEIWVRTTKITLSDGARPLAGQDVTVKQGGTTTQRKTNTYGQLPAIPHLSPGEQVELWIRNTANELEKIDSFVLGKTSKAFTYFTDFFSAQASTRPHIPVSVREKKKPAPFSYVVQPGDTVDKIAIKLKTSSGKIQQDNHLKNWDKIFPGQRITINGSIPASNTQPAASNNERGEKQIHIVAIPERSKEGQGQPLAIIPSDQKRAPWMEVALSEASLWAGTKENVIDREINYHQETNATFLKSMTGASNAWCASFVNWSLMKVGYDKWQNSFRARGVANDKNFIQIDSPIYGAIGLIGTHHVCLVYGKDKKTDHMICLGGNQSDQINFTVFKEAARYFVPITYLPYAKKEIAAGVTLNSYDAKELNKTFGIVENKKNVNATQ